MSDGKSEVKGRRKERRGKRNREKVSTTFLNRSLSPVDELSISTPLKASTPISVCKAVKPLPLVLVRAPHRIPSPSLAAPSLPRTQLPLLHKSAVRGRSIPTELWTGQKRSPSSRRNERSYVRKSFTAETSSFRRLARSLRR